MKWLLGTYTMRLNHRHRLFGHLFSGRYRALPVDASGTAILRPFVIAELDVALGPMAAGEDPARPTLDKDR